MKSWFYIRALACAALVTVATLSRAEPSLTVFAAASLKTALDQVASDWPQKVIISYGGSGTIARQISQGAPADVVILANTQWMDWLQTNGVVEPDAQQVILSNSLVLVAPSGSGPIKAQRDGAILKALKDGRLAIGQTNSVPAGIYGRAWLENIGLWPDLSPRLAETENVRAALAFVARGEAPVGLVYASDAAAEPRVEIVYRIPTNLHPKIRYSAAALSPQGESFLAFLTTSASKQIFTAFNFITGPSL